MKLFAFHAGVATGGVPPGPVPPGVFGSEGHPITKTTSNAKHETERKRFMIPSYRRPRVAAITAEVDDGGARKRSRLPPRDAPPRRWANAARRAGGSDER